MNLERLSREDRVDITQEIKQLYFHAGRFSGGARDYLAREAYRIYSVREGRVELKQARGK